MSNALAIAAVTLSLRNLLEASLQADDASIRVTTLPPDKAADDPQRPNRLNLFLYHTDLDASWRNRDMPRQVRPGETGQPPLPLNLYYLITAYGEPQEDGKDHRLLGRAMSVLQDHTILGNQEIRDALAGTGLDEQIDRIRITYQPLTLEELAKLWGAFQTNYRISAAYQVGVVLMESTRMPIAPLPVLRRGQPDRGVQTTAGTPPVLLQALPPPLRDHPPAYQAGVRLGDTFSLRGQGLDPEHSTVRLTNSRLPDTLDLAPVPGGSAEELTVVLPLAPAHPGDPHPFDRFAPGLYSAALEIGRPNLSPWSTNVVPLALAPRITVEVAGAAAATPRTAAAGAVTLNVTCSPRLRPEQTAAVRLMFGSTQLSVKTMNNPVDVSQPTALTFVAAKVDPGEYVIRLRVDGVDSLPYVAGGEGPLLDFDPSQKVIVE